jgi:hypothetical protein
VSGEAAEQLAELEALGLVDLVAEVAGGELVRLVDDDQVPLAVLELGLEVFVAGELVQAGDQQVVLLECVDPSGLVQGGCEQRELDAELLPQLVLPRPGSGAPRRYGTASARRACRPRSCREP